VRHTVRARKDETIEEHAVVWLFVWNAVVYHDACDDDDDDDDERWSTSGPGRRFDARLIELRSARVWIVVLA